MGRTPSRPHGRLKSSPKHFLMELYSVVCSLTSLVDLSSKKQSSKLEYRIRAHIPRELNMQARNPIQIKNEQHRTYAHILQELNMQAENPMQIRKEQHRTCAHILREFNMHAQWKRQRQGQRPRSPQGKSLTRTGRDKDRKDKYYPEMQAIQRSLRQEPQMDTTNIYIILSS